MKRDLLTYILYALPFIVVAWGLAFLHYDKAIKEPSKQYVEASNGSIRYEGRFLSISEGRRFDYPGSRIALKVSGSGVVYARLKPNAGYYALFVDGQEVSQINTHSVDFEACCRLDSLAEGEHELELVLKSEGIFCKPMFYGFELEGDLKLLPIERRKRKIEFIGNSITCGYGVDADNENCAFADSTSNFVHSYAFLTAQALQAELMVVARSGIGVYRNYGDSSEGSLCPMPVVYRRVLISEEATQWVFPDSLSNKENREPDLIIINLGTNDLSTEGYRMELLDKAYRDFLAEIRTHNPQAKILLLTGCMLTDMEVLTQFQSSLNAIVEERKEMGDDKIYRLDFAPQDGGLGYGADWHPSAAQQRQMAQALISMVQSLLNE